MIGLTKVGPNIGLLPVEMIKTKYLLASRGQIDIDFLFLCQSYFLLKNKGGRNPSPSNSCGPACDIVHYITFNYQDFEVYQLHQDQLAMICPMNMFHNHGTQVLLFELCSYWL
jgi:hypothetical protein